MNDLIEIIMDDARKIVEVIPFTDLRKKKILITGASGIIGINLLSMLKGIVNNLFFCILGCGSNTKRTAPLYEEFMRLLSMFNFTGRPK